MTGIDASRPFRWQDGERLILYGPGVLEEAVALASGGGAFEVLTTARSAPAAPALIAGAARVQEVPAGRVDELAAALLDAVGAPTIVALGGGRIIDTAKAIAAARPPRRVVAVPTTLSGAEMTVIHRHAMGVPFETPHVRPAVVVCDPALAASQPAEELAASAGNALGHALEGPLTPMTNPIARLAALAAAELLFGAFGALGEPGDELDRPALALGAMLAGYTIDSSRYGLHHVLAQTLVRVAGVGHGQANTAMLPVTMDALERRVPGWVEGPLGDALGGDAIGFARRLGELAGARSLRQIGVPEGALEQCSREAASRPELHLTPPPADRDELLELYRAAL